MKKSAFIAAAQAYGVEARYSGTNSTMFVIGNDQKVKSFIRVCNLKGKKTYSFEIAQG